MLILYIFQIILINKYPKYKIKKHIFNKYKNIVYIKKIIYFSPEAFYIYLNYHQYSNHDYHQVQKNF